VGVQTPTILLESVVSPYIEYCNIEVCRDNSAYDEYYGIILRPVGPMALLLPTLIVDHEKTFMYDTYEDHGMRI